MGCRAIKNAKNPKIYKKIVDSFVTMLNSGLRSIFMGGECANNTINREVMYKGINSTDIIHTIKAARDAEVITGKKLDIALAFIFPTPLVKGITLDKVRNDNVNLVKKCKPDSVMVTPPGPFKKTNWYSNKKFGFKLDKDIIKKVIDYEYVLYEPPTSGRKHPQPKDSCN